MWLKSHKWNLIPSTSYEIRREMRVRESMHTYMLFDKRYYDIDTGKFITDKIPKINSYSWADLVEGTTQTTGISNYYFREENFREEKENEIIDFKIPKFVPKDTDFDVEDELERKRVQKELELRKEMEYQKQVRETEERLARQERLAYKRDNVIYLGGPNHAEKVSDGQYIITNKWRVK